MNCVNGPKWCKGQRFRNNDRNGEKELRFKLLVIAPPSDSLAGTLRQWAARLTEDLPDFSIVVANDDTQAKEQIGEADGVLGTLTPELLGKAKRLKWLHSPRIAPPAGYFFPEL